MVRFSSVSLLAAFAWLVCAAAAHAGLNTACMQWPGSGQPAAAAAHSYNCLRWNPSLRSTSSIDTADTGDATKDLFIHNTWPSTPAPSAGGWDFDIISPTPSTDWSITTAGQLRLAPVSNTPYAGLPVQMMSCRYSATSGYIGKAFGPGYYVEVNSAISFTDSATAGSWNIWWMVPLPILTGTSPWRVSELDGMEYLAVAINFQYHDWSGTGGTVTFNDAVGSNFSIYAGSAGVFENLGLLSVPVQFNGGATGLVARYQNNVHAADSDLSFNLTTPSTPAPGGGGHNGNYSPLDNQQDCIAIAAGQNQYHLIDFMRVWAR